MASKPTVEFLIPADLSRLATPMLQSLYMASTEQGFRAMRSTRYRGTCEWLVLYGVGHVLRNPARNAQIKQGGHAILWDLGYFNRKPSGFMRVSIDHDHPQAHLDTTPNHPARWQHHNIQLRNDYNPNGPIILAGLGPKSKSYLRMQEWEAHKYAELRTRFPGRKIVYRPKPGKPYTVLAVKTDSESKIEDVLRGASLVVARHSNVCVDACIAGVPFECEDGAAKWLEGKEYTEATRLDFLHRLAWWQWTKSEARAAWHHICSQLGVHYEHPYS